MMTASVLKQVVSLPVEHVRPNPKQPRAIFCGDSLCELAQSIEENGLLQPISVREITPGCFELIAGERRLRAFRLLGRTEIPGIVEEMDDLTSQALAFIENMQRDALSFFEQAEAIHALIEQNGLTQQEVAQKLSMAQSTIANKLRLLRLEAPVRKKILDYGFTERHARCLLSLSNPTLQLQAAKEIAHREMNVAQADRYIEKLREEMAPRQTRTFIPKDVRIFLNTIDKAIETMVSAGIAAQTERGEDEEFICYTVRIPKNARKQLLHG